MKGFTWDKLISILEKYISIETNISDELTPEIIQTLIDN